MPKSAPCLNQYQIPYNPSLDYKYNIPQNYHNKSRGAAKRFKNKMRVKLPRWAPAVDLVTLVHVGVPLCALLCVVVHLL